MKKRLYRKRLKKELQKDALGLVDGEYLTEKMIKKMSIKELNELLWQDFINYIALDPYDFTD
jgi:hypothetical protein